MNRGAQNKLTKKTRDADKAGAHPSPTDEKRHGTVARELIEHAAGWAGNDLEEIIAIVASTRSRSRF